MNSNLARANPGSGLFDVEHMNPKRKRKARVIVLPGVERRDLLNPIADQTVLKRALDAGVTDATIIGKDRAGEFYVATYLGDADRAVGMLHRAICVIAGSRIEND